MDYTKLLIALAVAPGAFLAWKVYSMDKIEKEPKKLLVKLFAFGALSIISALILESVGDLILSEMFDSDTWTFILLENFIVVACVEEGGKYLALKLGSWKHPAFNYRFDAIVYAVCVSLGFAILENISYAFSYGIVTTLVRAVTAIPAHTIFGIFMGHYYGQAKLYSDNGNKRLSKRYLRRAYIVPSLLHGFYDVLAGDESGLGWLLFIVFVVFLDWIAIRRVKKDSANDIVIE